MERKIIAQNSTARHNYTIENTYEAGIVLTRHRNKIYS